MGVECVMMLKRLFKYNRFFTVLFLLSFLISFIIMYYGMDLNRQFIRVSAVREESLYQYGYAVTGVFQTNVETSNRIPEELQSRGNIVFRCDGPIGEGVINTDAIDVLWTENEEMLEPVKYENYYLNGDFISAPKCIIGDAWENETYVVNGIRYIKIFKIESCVIGEYVSNNFRGRDERCTVFRDSLSQKELDKLIFDTGGISIIYESNLEDDSELFKEWIDLFLEESSIHEIPIGVWSIRDGESFKSFMRICRIMYVVMMLFCFTNCAFLAYFWGETHLYEYMLKRTLGYGRLKLFVDIIEQFALFEIIALGMIVFLTYHYELFRGHISNWYDNLRLGFLQMAGIFLLFGIVLSLFPMRVVMRQKPADVLKNID